jgi:DNA-binding transcriptional LysR family regulator
VGVALFERTNRQVRLTLAGQAFANGSAQVLRDLDRGIAQTMDVAQGFTGFLNVGYTDTVIAGRLPDIIKTFRGIAPAVHIRLIQGYTDQQFDMLDKGQLDIGLMTGPIEREGFETLDIQTDRLMAILPSDHPLARRSVLNLRDLAGEPFVMGDPDRWGAFNVALFREFQRLGFRPSVLQTAPESRAIIGLVACGLGVSIMPEGLVRAADPRLTVRPVADLTAPLITQASWLASSDQPVLARFVAHLAALPETAHPES